MGQGHGAAFFLSRTRTAFWRICLSFLILRCTQGALRKTLAGHCNCLLSVDFQPKTYILASGSYDTKIIQWDAETGQ